MKRFLIKLIATTLLLIVILSSFGCFGCWSCITGGEYISCYECSNDIFSSMIGTSSAKDRRLQKEFLNRLSEIPLETSGYELVYTADNSISPPKTVMYNNILYNIQLNRKDFGNTYTKSLNQFYYDYSLTIYKDGDEDNKVVIDTNYIKDKSVSANRIMAVITELEKPPTFSPYSILEFDNKLFIFCLGADTKSGYQFLNYEFWTPSIIFEYDIENNLISYAGYFRNEGEAPNNKSKIQKTN